MPRRETTKPEAETARRLFRRREENLHVRHQSRALEQAAEFFFGDRVVRPPFGVRAGHRLVFHRQPLQPDDAEILAARFPNLALLQLHGSEKKGGTGVGDEILDEGCNLVSLISRPGNQVARGRNQLLLRGRFFLARAFRGFLRGFFSCFSHVVYLSSAGSLTWGMISFAAGIPHHALFRRGL